MDSTHPKCKCGLYNLHTNTVRVTNLSPFPCPPTSTDPDTTGAVYPNTETEPSIDVAPNHGHNKPIVAVSYQQDIYNRNTGCNAAYMKISLDGGNVFGNAIALPNVQCFGGPYERASHPQIAITPKNDILFAGLGFNVVENFKNDVNIAKYDLKTGNFLYTKNLDPQSGNGTGPDDSIIDYPTLVVDPQDCTGKTAYMGWTRYWIVNPDAGYYRSNLAFSKTKNGFDWSKPTVYAETPELLITLGYNSIPPGSDATIGFNNFALLDNPKKCYSKIISVFSGNAGLNNGAINQYNLLYSVYSLNQGKTWSEPVLFDITFNGGSGQTATQIVDPDDYSILIRGGDGVPFSAADRHRNRIFAVAGLDSLLNLPIGTAPGIYLFVSLDAAKTWKTVGKVNRYKSVTAFNPSITVLENGNVAISYYDFRNHTPNPDTLLPLETDRWLDVFSYDEHTNTVKLESETRLTNKSFNFRNAVPLFGGGGTTTGYTLGDYMGIKSYNCKIYNAYGVANIDPDNKTDIYSTTATL
jgi:hypothetical protein